uniref:Uncharacterized protein n=1 Tax=viral metagenome TaxID=1070528 RepID=A0A6M3K7L7_9ZZZZ
MHHVRYNTVMDISACCKYITRHTKKVCRRLHVKDWEDAAQDACLSMWDEWQRRNVDKRLLRIIAFRCSVDALRVELGCNRPKVFGASLLELHELRSDVKGSEEVAEVEDLLDFVSFRLSGRSRAIFEAMRHGCTSGEMSCALNIQEKTLWVHVQTMLQSAREILLASR